MIVVRIKGIKYSYLKRYKGDETAEKFVEDITMKWSDYTIKTIGIEIEVEGKETITFEDNTVVEVIPAWEWMLQYDPAKA